MKNNIRALVLFKSKDNWYNTRKHSTIAKKKKVELSHQFSLMELTKIEL